MKMFVWPHILCNYTCGLACVLAHDVEEARAVLRAKFETECGGEIYGSYAEALANEPQVFASPTAVFVWGGG